MTNSKNLPVSLHEVAHGRTGDKGNRVNVSIIAYIPEVYPLLLEQVTVSRIGELIAHRRPGVVIRYELPKLWALNFVIDDVLEGGVNASLNLDGHGKTLSFLFLSLCLDVPRQILEECQSVRAGYRQ